MNFITWTFVIIAIAVSFTSLLFGFFRYFNIRRIPKARGVKKSLYWGIGALVVVYVIGLFLWVKDKDVGQNTIEVLEQLLAQGQTQKVIEKGEKEEVEMRAKLMQVQILVMKTRYRLFIEKPDRYSLYDLMQKYADTIEHEIGNLQRIGIEFLAIVDTIRALGFNEVLERYPARREILILSDRGLAELTKLKMYSVEDLEHLTRIVQSYNESNYVNALDEIDRWRNALEDRQYDLIRFRLKAVDMPYFAHKLRTLRWINYTPPRFAKDDNIVVEARIRKDLALLRENGFLGIVIGFAVNSRDINIPKIAQETGLKGCVLGIRDITNASEKEYAFGVRQYVDAYFIDNFSKHPRSEYGLLIEATASLRRRTGKPISITNAYWDYIIKARTRYGDIADPLNEDLMSMQDWVFVELPRPPVDVRELVMMDSRFHGFAQRERQIVMYRRIPVPSRGDNFDEEGQRDYYQNMIEETDLLFVFCEAFDQNTSSTGLFTSDRKPKRVIEYLTKPEIVFTSRTWYGDLHLMKGKVLNISDPRDYKILTYIKVGDTWWSKPYNAHPTVPINEDFSWQVPIITGGFDYNCTQVKVYLVRKEYDPRYRSRPDSSDAIATVQITRVEKEP